MNVAELIEQLKKFLQNMPVMINIGDTNFHELTEVPLRHFIEIFDYHERKFQEILPVDIADSLDDDSIYMGLTGEAVQAVSLGG